MQLGTKLTQFNQDEHNNLQYTSPKSETIYLKIGFVIEFLLEFRFKFFKINYISILDFILINFNLIFLIII